MQHQTCQTEGNRAKNAALRRTLVVLTNFVVVIPIIGIVELLHCAN